MISRAGRWAVVSWPLVALLGCDNLVELGECGFFDDCEMRYPSGLHCGLAHDGFGHAGASCQVDNQLYDPAWTKHSSGAWTVRDAPTPCPPDFTQVYLDDHDSPNGRKWATCSHQGDPDFDEVELAQLPAGAACGLTELGGPPGDCMGYDPGSFDCPPGFELRFIVDEYVDDYDEYTCLTIGSPDGSDVPGTAKPLFDIYTFCQVKASVGCTEPECVGPQVAGGTLCGLHNRNWWEAGRYEFSPWDADDEPDNAQCSGDWDPAEESPASLTYPLRDMQMVLDSLRDRCTDNAEIQEWMARLQESMDNAESAAPSCLGKELLNAGGCPTDMVLTCTGDHLYSNEQQDLWVCPSWSAQGICWCTSEALVQPYEPPEG